MFVELVLSLFGFVFVIRILSLVEKLEVLSSTKLKVFFGFLLLPIYLNLFFKELFVFVFIYIGIFFITLILFDKIIAYLMQKTFVNLHLELIQRIILLLTTGKSASTSVAILFNELSAWQKLVFLRLNKIFEIKTTHNSAALINKWNNSSYFDELETILRSSSHVLEQLKALSEGLALQHNLQRKSQLAIKSARNQAVAIVFVYISIFLMSFKFLNLQVFSMPAVVSSVMFLTGQFIVFKMGGHIKWKT